MRPRARIGGVLAAIIVAGAAVLLARAAEAVTVTTVRSTGGIEAWLVEDHSLPLIALDFAVEGGAGLDPQGKEGLAVLAMGLIDEGAGDLDAGAFKQRLEDLAIRLRFAASADAVSGSLQTLTENADAAFDLLRLSLTSPRFDAAAIERVKGQIEAQLRQAVQEPNQIGERLWWRTGFPGHPYGRRRMGTLASVAAIEAPDLRRFMTERLGRDRLKIGVVGDIAPARLGPLLDRAFGALPAEAAAGVIPETSLAAEPALILVRKPIPQSVVVFGAPGLKRDDPDWYAASVLNDILGGGTLTSRLGAEIREKRGLSYGINTGLAAFDHAGVIMGHVATRNDRVAEMIAVLRVEWRRFRDEGPTAAELDVSKTYLAGSFPLSLDSTSRLASLLVGLQVDHLGIDYLDRRAGLIERVTAADVRRVAQRLLNPDALRIVVTGAPPELPGAREMQPDGG